jgi:hypothetical protein
MTNCNRISCKGREKKTVSPTCVFFLSKSKILIRDRKVNKSWKHDLSAALFYHHPVPTKRHTFKRRSLGRTVNACSVHAKRFTESFALLPTDVHAPLVAGQPRQETIKVGGKREQ